MVYKTPLPRHLYAEMRGLLISSDKFYVDVRQQNMVENELKRRARADDDPEGFAKRLPLAKLVGAGNQAERRVSELRKQRREIIRQGLPGYQAEVREVNAQIGEVMKGLNLQVREAKKAAQ